MTKIKYSAHFDHNGITFHHESVPFAIVPARVLLKELMHKPHWEVVFDSGIHSSTVDLNTAIEIRREHGGKILYAPQVGLSHGKKT
jgi:hypothetical protein